MSRLNDSYSETSSLESEDWIQEEELLIKYAESDSFELMPLTQIAITFIYVDRNQDAVESIDEMLDLKITNSNHSIIEWTQIKQIADSVSSRNGLRYRFSDATYYHSIVNYENLDLFRPTTQLTKIERDIEVKLASSLPAFHDISQVFVIMREVIPVPIGQSLKSILKTGSKIAKTKKVRIFESHPDIIGASGSSRKTRKTD